jgi:hypothetical protein
MSAAPGDVEQVALGVVVVLIAPDGRMVVSVSDFNRSGYGGFTLQEAQTMRAKEALARTAIRAFCNDDLADVIDRYRAEEIIRALCDKKKYRVEMIVIGHKDPAR